MYTLGHRGTLGLAMHPGTGEMWQNENGPNGGDEINILKPGRNYGWPIVSLGRDYPGPLHNGAFGHAGFEPPVVYWMPAIGVSGMAFYTGDKLPKWKGDVFVGALRTGEIPALATSSAFSSTRNGRAAPRIAADRVFASDPRRPARARMASCMS